MREENKQELIIALNNYQVVPIQNVCDQFDMFFVIFDKITSCNIVE